MPIKVYLKDFSAFAPEAIEAMSKALEQVCEALQIDGQIKEREIIATRIIDLARTGIVDAKSLSQRVIAETRALRSL
jgi:hypothetical protein